MLRLSLLGLAACAAASHPAAPPASQGRVLPARFEAGRIVLTPRTTGGETLELIASTTVPSMLCGAAAPQIPRGPQRGNLPSFEIGAGVPEPSTPGGFMPMAVCDGGESGRLGRDWFAGRVWQIDYRHQRLTLLERAPEASRWLPLAAEVPTLTVEIDGQPHLLLLDLAATTYLGDQALAAVADGLPAMRAISWIDGATFDGWRARHPDWRVIERAEATLGLPMIQVPSVRIDGQGSGPVWFMRGDSPPGHAGGNLLGYFVITLDYPGRRLALTPG